MPYRYASIAKSPHREELEHRFEDRRLVKRRACAELQSD